MVKGNISPDLVCVFPGQGSQRIGMAKDFYDAFSESREVFDLASETLQIDFVELCFIENELLDLTEFTQPAILTAEMAMFSGFKAFLQLNNMPFYPKFFAGHSLGEYSALTAAGVLDLASALKIVRKRGQLMQSVAAPKDSAMAAIIGEKLNLQDLEIQCQENGCVIANYNSPQQVVISGGHKGVVQIVQHFEQTYPEVRASLLNVSAPFHSPIMRSIEKEFGDFLGKFNFNHANVEQVYSNFSGEQHNQPSLLKNLIRQISEPVRWQRNMEQIAFLHLPIVEIGPQRVLGKFFAAMGLEVTSVTNIRSLNRLNLNEIHYEERLPT